MIRLLHFFLETRRLRRRFAGRPELLVPALGEAVERFCMVKEVLR